MAAWLRVATTVSVFIKSHLHISHGLTYVAVTARKDKPDDLLERLNNYHPNIVFIDKENPDHFLDTAFTYDND